MATEHLPPGPTEHARSVLDEVLAERTSQKAKGYDEHHDDAHTQGEIELAAFAYIRGDDSWPMNWQPPVGFEDMPKRERLIKGIAMLVAEVERRDRKEQRGGE